MKTLKQAQKAARTAIQLERNRQAKKWGEQNHDPFTWLALLAEETGEASQQALFARFHKESPPGCGSADEFREHCLKSYEQEMVQVAAVAQAAVECMKRGEWTWSNTQPERLNGFCGRVQLIRNALSQGAGIGHEVARLTELIEDMKKATGQAPAGRGKYGG